MLQRTSSPTSTSSTTSSPSSYGLTGLYGTLVQTVVEVEDELMEEGETTDSDSSMEEGQFDDTRQSTPDSMDIGILHVPSNWMQPSSP